jgi:hypothetical protein
MDQKTIAIAVIVIVVIAVVGVGAYWVLSNPGENGGNEPTPTPTATPTGVADATSLEYSVEITGGDSAGSYDFYAKNIGTNDLMIRLDIPLGDMNFTYIVNGAEQKAWANEGSGWVDLSSTYQDQYDLWQPTYEGYVDQLASWTSGDYTYTSGDSTITISGIMLNPTLPDSLFQAPAA